MTEITYQIVEHDGGWAYKLGDVFSETFPSHEDAERAAKRVATVQEVPGEPEVISYQDENGAWHEEQSAGGDRPHVVVSE